MKRIDTQITGCCIIEPDVFEDHRGLFFEVYNQAKFHALGVTDTFVQDNQSTSRAGVLRGLHFQYPPRAMAKLVRCSRGEVFDVIVDMRRASPTFKHWVGVELSEKNHRMVYIPAGCAHGFYAVTDCDLIYKCAELFDATLDGGFVWNDPEIGVVWPFAVEPILSERDAQQPRFAEVLARL